ncbi:(+)-neomenthol dehydrogenase-like [Punica granatum]|uniref:Short-chain dehydrogenase/reductase n=1 Tax=Punica granatum TaxID=22663 RepID=A0A218VWD4_PUNGR|nr:(+)-neomenthol dehydrogenase-like [Punica granatum]OWM64202.1 hypothetical protein CDL15_Pgr018773 [Punica granatum]
MAEASAFLATQRHAVVTGANKGIGFEICRQLASKGLTVVLTSREEKRGLEALRKLKEESCPALLGEVVFHRLDVTDPASIDSLVEFTRNRIGKLDILVNNAGVGGIVYDFHAFADAIERAGGWPTDEEKWRKKAAQNYELAIECLETNYYGAKRVTEALLPLLQQSSSARIVNVASYLGLLQHIPGKQIRDELGDIENLTKDRIEEILKDFIEDFRQGQLEAKGWPENISAYKMSKAALIAYTRLLAKEFPSVLVNGVCPGFVKTDINGNNGVLSAQEGAESPVYLALLPKTGPSGLLFSKKEVCSF